MILNNVSVFKKLSSRFSIYLYQATNLLAIFEDYYLANTGLHIQEKLRRTSLHTWPLLVSDSKKEFRVAELITDCDMRPLDSSPTS